MSYSTIGDSLNQICTAQHVIDFGTAAAGGQLAGHVLKSLGLDKALAVAGVARHRSSGSACFSDAVVAMVLHVAREHDLRLIGRRRKQLLPALLALAQSPEHAEEYAALVIPVTATSTGTITKTTAEAANPYFIRHFGAVPQLSIYARQKRQTAIAETSPLVRAIRAALAVLRRQGMGQIDHRH